jgi:hypothetical protein
MNQETAHFSRLHHTGVTDVINAKPRVDATRTAYWQGKPTSLLLSQKMLSDFARACRARDLPVVIMHQDAFAADYHLRQRSLRTWKESRDC